MYQDLRILAVDPNMQQRKVVIELNFDVDAESITDSSIELYGKAERNRVEYVSEIIGKTIVLTLTSWPIPNFEYVIAIQNLKNVMGEELASGMRRKLIFKSSICSTVQILYPAYGEVITDLKASWKEVLADKTHEIVGSFLIEVSKENTFYTLERHSEVTGSHEINLQDLPDGQYYLRVRAQKDGELGTWSEVVTFLVGEVAAKPEPIFDSGDLADDDEDIYIPDIKILSMSEDGVTPGSILIELDCEIDPDLIGDILVIRRVI